jgi:Kef-type K+ transport system membrane component KefB
MDPVLQVILILAAAKTAGEIVERVGFPALIGEISAGILLGPSLLGLIAYDGTLAFLADVGIIALLFISGIQMNIRTFAASEKSAVSTALLGVIVPFLMGAGFGVVTGFSLLETLFLGIALSITSIGISVRTLIDLRKMDTPSGTTIVGAAVIDDIIGILLLAVLTAVAAGSGRSALYTVTAGGAFLAVSLILGRRLLPAVMARARATHTHEMPYTAAIAIALFMGYLSNLAGLHYAVGAFLAGLLLGDQIRDDRTLFEGIADFSFGFFVTIFFASIGLLAVITPETLLSPFIFPLILIAFAGKILGGWIGSVWFMKTSAESLVVGIGLCPRGEITLVVGKIALLAGLITQEIFSAFTVMVIVSVLVTPALMAWGYRWQAVRDGRRSAGAR